MMKYYYKMVNNDEVAECDAISEDYVVNICWENIKKFFEWENFMFWKPLAREVMCL